MMVVVIRVLLLMVRGRWLIDEYDGSQIDFPLTTVASERVATNELSPSAMPITR